MSSGGNDSKFVLRRPDCQIQELPDEIREQSLSRLLFDLNEAQNSLA